MRILPIVFFASLVTVPVTTAYAQNLNKEYGSYWNCSYITAGLPLYDYCKPCEDKGMDFFKDTETTGHCVPRNGEEASQPEPVTPPSTKKAPPAKARVQYTIRFCNDTAPDKLFVSIGTHDQLGGVMRFTVRGWYSIAVGECKNLAVKEFGRYNEMVFAYHAQAGKKYWPTKVWPHSENMSIEEFLNSPSGRVNFCVDPKNRFERYTHPPQKCVQNNKRAFGIIWVDKEEDVEMVVKEVRIQ